MASGEGEHGRWGGVAGRRVLITGATGGIGLAGARELARRGAQLAIVARDEARGRAVVQELARLQRDTRAGHGGQRPDQTPAADLLLADLSSQAQVRRVAAEALERYERIDVLINNAGAMFRRRRESEDGIELTWALNHLAPFLLTALLLDRLRQSAPARIITTASDAHKGARIPFEDIAGLRAYRGAGFGRYGQTKLANILFTTELARRLEGSGVSANCMHPGLVATGFNRGNGPLMSAMMTLARPFSRSPERGARTIVWLADAEEAAGESGGYFVDERRTEPSAAARELDAARALWELSEEQTRPPVPEP